jgi:putative Holliday junction resolvase
MSVDYGDSRTGLAISDETEFLAKPLKIIKMRNVDICVNLVAEQAELNNVGLIVVGHPINMNGTLGPRSELCTEFAEKLRGVTDIEVIMWDERSSTVTAINMMNEINRRGKKRKETLDAVAAAVILENYLDFRRTARDKK